MRLHIVLIAGLLAAGLAMDVAAKRKDSRSASSASRAEPAPLRLPATKKSRGADKNHATLAQLFPSGGVARAPRNESTKSNKATATSKPIVVDPAPEAAVGSTPARAQPKPVEAPAATVAGPAAD